MAAMAEEQPDGLPHHAKKPEWHWPFRFSNYVSPQKHLKPPPQVRHPFPQASSAFPSPKKQHQKLHYQHRKLLQEQFYQPNEHIEGSFLA